MRARAANQLRQRGDEGGIGALGRNPEITWHAEPFGQTAVVLIEFHQGLRMLGYKSDRHDPDRNLVMRGPLEVVSLLTDSM